MKTLPINLLMVRYGLLYKALIRYNKNNMFTQQYKKEGFDILSKKIDTLPEDIAFRPSFIKKSSCIKIYDKLFIFISKNNLKKPKETRFDALFHEIGHWLHFQNLPAKEDAQKIWNSVNIKNVENKVSKRATEGKNGLEFVAEVVIKVFDLLTFSFLNISSLNISLWNSSSRFSTPASASVLYSSPF